MDRAHYLRMERTFGRGGHGKSRPVGEQIEGHEKFVANTKRFEEEKRKEIAERKRRGLRNPAEETLEQRFGVIIAFLVAGIALIFSSLRPTGNAVSNLTQTTPGLLGLIFFIAGILGIIFYIRRK